MRILNWSKSYIRQSVRSTKSCGGRRLWNTWQTSQRPEDSTLDVRVPLSSPTPHLLLHHPVVVLSVITDHDRGLAWSGERQVQLSYSQLSHRLSRSLRGVLPRERSRSCRGGRRARPGYRTWRWPTGSTRCRGPRHCCQLPAKGQWDDYTPPAQYDHLLVHDALEVRLVLLGNVTAACSKSNCQSLSHIDQSNPHHESSSSPGPRHCRYHQTDNCRESQVNIIILGI